MTTRYVAIDTETTGVDLVKDEIIEVAAIAFGLDGTGREFRSLVRPLRPPSYQIERLTGIRAEDLESAPRFGTIASEVADFIGSSPVIGHNVAFDLGFLERAGVRSRGPAYDTLELAQIVLPAIGEYSLRNVAAFLGVEFPVQHRALADAEATRAVFLALRRRLAELPDWLLGEIERLAIAGEWSLAALFREVRESAAATVSGAGLTTNELLAPPAEIEKPLGAPGPHTLLPEEDVLSLLEAAAGLADVFADFERRPEQEAMAVGVTRALNEGRHLVVEAGTGTGKSLAYLLPAALHALRNSERVVVSTDTIGLQEQLTAKDLPVVQRLLAQSEGKAPRVAQMKGRRNYLCLLRWTAARHALPASREEARLQARLLVWLMSTQTGDRAELNLYGGYDAAWSRLSAENTGCLQTPCSFVKDGTCFLQRARRRAEAAHVLVVNHALLLSDVATAGHVLPPYSRLVIDEAHNLEDEATARFAFKAAEGDVAAFVDRVGRRASERAGIVGSLAEATRRSTEILGAGAYIATLASALADAAGRIRQRLGDPFRLLASVLRDSAYTDGDADDRLLITRTTRVQPLWSDVQIAAENLDGSLQHLVSLLNDLRAVLDSGEPGLPGQEALGAEALDLYQTGVALRGGLAACLLEEDPTLICWLERSRSSGEVAVCTAPLQVSEILRGEVFEAKETAVLTSATLSAEGRFDFFRERVGLDDADELLLGSPFDFERSTLILLPTDLPEPNEPEFAAATGDLLTEACRASGGRALVLFTSYGALNAAYRSMKSALEAEGILVLAHGTDGSPRQMLAALRENPRTVLLGTASFWEGVDVAGEALSLLVIARLPFAVPSDPIYQARSALYDEPFDQYALPQAVLRFRQGFGRLIRTKTDRGVLVVLDRRLRSRRYGEAFLRSLPRCTLREPPSRDVPDAIEAWLR